MNSILLFSGCVKQDVELPAQEVPTWHLQGQSDLGNIRPDFHHPQPPVARHNKQEQCEGRFFKILTLRHIQKNTYLYVPPNATILD